MGEPEVVPWGELTPMARYALLLELNEMLDGVPNQEVVPMLREQVNRNHLVIPYMVAEMRARLRGIER